MIVCDAVFVVVPDKGVAEAVEELGTVETPPDDAVRLSSFRWAFIFFEDLPRLDGAWLE